ncbi:hypothetical protein [Collimonas pratensis]|uniref:Lipoprotein n=1 Tax=Collimonas pratensis TaxID=279113 RepID=A0ABM5Z2F4_9BURK|nr:hypothetical protein [Collimonas pratensis]AMP13215.1 hypothetical protein CPter291_0936 [Collimonas pratensis]
MKMTSSMRHLRLLLSAAALAACACQSVAGDRLQFEGVPLESGETLLAHAAVNPAGQMQLDLGQQGVVTISPWPKALPGQLQAQYATLRQTLHPAGPLQSLLLRTAEEQEPWLTLVANGGLNWGLLPGIRLRVAAGGGVRIAGLKTNLSLVPGETVKFRDGAMHCWQFGLLAVRLPQGRVGISQEGEARADWYLRGDVAC